MLPPMHLFIFAKEGQYASPLHEYLHTSHHVCTEITFSNHLPDLDMPQDVDVCVFDVSKSAGSEHDVDLIKDIRIRMPHVPIILVTKEGEQSRFRELMIDEGVDSCIQVPFTKEELFLRVDNLLRRNKNLFGGTIIGARNIIMDIRNHKVTKKGKHIKLTPAEYCILFHLLIHKNTLVRAEDLLTCIKRKSKTNTQILNVHIFNLRKKLDDTDLIVTVPQYGFTIAT